MELSKLIEKYHAEFTKNVISSERMSEAEKEMNVQFGEELKTYLMSYGYLALNYVELYGINSVQGLDSDMVVQTKYLHKYFPASSGLTALENLGDGEYILVDKEDRIFSLSLSENHVKPLEQSLFEYINRRFEEISGL